MILAITELEVEDQETNNKIDLIDNNMMMMNIMFRQLIKDKIKAEILLIMEILDKHFIMMTEIINLKEMNIKENIKRSSNNLKIE